MYTLCHVTIIRNVSRLLLTSSILKGTPIREIHIIILLDIIIIITFYYFNNSALRGKLYSKFSHKNYKKII